MSNYEAGIIKPYLNHPRLRSLECKTRFTPLYHNQRFCLDDTCRRVHLGKIKLRYRQKKNSAIIAENKEEGSYDYRNRTLDHQQTRTRALPRFDESP